MPLVPRLTAALASRWFPGRSLYRRWFRGVAGILSQLVFKILNTLIEFGHVHLESGVLRPECCVLGEEFFIGKGRFTI